MPYDHLELTLPIGHHMKLKGKWILGAVCSVDGHVHKIGEHTGDSPCACNIHLVVIEAPPTE